MLKVGLVGYGYWGPNLARNFNANPDFTLAYVAEMDPRRASMAQRAYPHVTVVGAPDFLDQEDVDVVVIATPVFTHYDLAKKALKAGKHVWLEKPMTSNSEQAKELVDLAASQELTLMVDHTFLFTGPVMAMKDLIDQDELGSLYYYDSVRINLGLFQHDVNVIWDLAPHDLSIMDYLLGPSAEGVCAHGSDHFNTNFEDVAYVTVYYPDNLIAHFHLNWLSPVKIRRTVVGGSKRMLLWNDIDKEESLKVYDKGMDVTTREGVYRILATPRIGEMTAPVVNGREALDAEVEYFAECIKEGKRPHNDGQAGLRIVKMLEATDRSLAQRGAMIEL
jgi:predicted dehydrogenase